jgi:hypothetical protein
MSMKYPPPCIGTFGLSVLTKQGTRVWQVRKLAQLGYRVLLQRGLGGQQEASSYTDEAYTHAGAVLVPTPRDVWSEADVMVAVNRPSLKLANAGQVGQSLGSGERSGAVVGPASRWLKLARRRLVRIRHSQP